MQSNPSRSHQERESSLRAMMIGCFLSILFAISNAYLALKIGTTISASIPAAILSMAIFRIFFRSGSLLEKNIIQTIATVGEGLAGGIIFTIPALFFLGSPPSILSIILLAFLGGVLGVLFMIPMRRFIIVEEHGKLPFPEGTACAEILQAGEEKAGSAISAAWGFLVASVYKVLSGILHLWQELVRIPFPFLQTEIAVDTTPALLAVGYIIGYRVSSILFAGSLLAWFVFIPLIELFGQGNVAIFPSNTPIETMSAMGIWDEYVRYIGAGMIAFGGLTSLVKISPMLVKTLREGTKELLQGFSFHKTKDRTEKDLPFLGLALGSVIIIALLWLLPFFSFNFFTICLLVVLGFFFSAVTSLTVGIIGSTSNPVSGMVITTLLITCLSFVFLGWTERVYLISAITMSAVANVTICMAATTSQDLKTGFLLKATPYKQQLVEIVGTILPAIALGFCVYLLNEAYTLGSSAMPAPQASMMAMIASGVINGQLPYTLFGIGIALGLVLECLRVPTLPFALGVYLPLSLTTATMAGGLMAYLLKLFPGKKQIEKQGVLLASGIVGGDASMGVLIAILAVLGSLSTEDLGILPPYFSLIAYAFLAVFFILYTYHKGKKSLM